MDLLSTYCLVTFIFFVFIFRKEMNNGYIFVAPANLYYYYYYFLFFTFKT